MFGNTGGHVVGGQVTGHESPAGHQPFPATFNDAHHVYLTDTPQYAVDQPRRSRLATWTRIHGGWFAGAIVVGAILLVGLLIAFV
jgi:hypothetical protein